MPSFSFNGIKKPYVSSAFGGRKRQIYNLKRNLLYTPGRPGAYLESTDEDVTIIEEQIIINAKSGEDLQKLKEDIAAWLVTDEPKPLIFDDEPDRTYFAMVEGILEIEDFVNLGSGTITFICPDPYKYGPERKQEFTSAASFNVEGTVETEPIIEVTLKKDTEYVAVSNGEKINMVGFPAKQGQTPTEPETEVFRTSGETLVGWTNSAEPSLEGYPNTGLLKSDGNSFWTDDYGYYEPNPGIWHGPAMKTSLSAPVQDFRFDVGLRALATALNQAGGIEVSLLDASSRYIARVAITKHYAGMPTTYARVRAGTRDNGHDVIPEDWAQYGNFHGVFRVIRNGNFWEAQIHAINYGWSKIVHKWTDYEGIATSPVTQVQVRLFQRGEFDVIDQIVDDIVVYRINHLSDNQVPLIGKAGDKVVFNHKDDIITKNGLSINEQKAFIGDFFKLAPGKNSIVTEPTEAIESVKVRYQSKWR